MVYSKKKNRLCKSCETFLAFMSMYSIFKFPPLTGLQVVSVSKLSCVNRKILISLFPVGPHLR